MPTIRANGIDLAYECHGTGSPVLFVHGFPLTGKLWAHVVEPLQASCKLIIPDLRGMGRSQPSIEASMAAYADDLAALLDAIGETRPAVVVGLSMGGYVIFEFYRRHRKRIRALVLADTRCEADTAEKARDRAAMAARVQEEGAVIVADAMLDALFGPAASLELRAAWRGIISSTDPTGVAAALGAMAARPDSTPTLAEIDVPTLIVVGEHDALTPPADARTMHEGIPGSRLAVIPDAGHMVPVEQPEAFSGMLRDFLAELDR